MEQLIISLYDYTGEMVRPWAENGYECHCFDIQHPDEPSIVSFEGGGSIHKIHWDLQKNLLDLQYVYTDQGSGIGVKIVFGFPVCTDLAVSGAAHFAKKAAINPNFQEEAASHARDIAYFAESLDVPYMIENPVSVLSTLWKRPDFYFHPYEYGGYIPENKSEHPLYPEYIAPKDAYSKKTSIWSGGGFNQPPLKPVECLSYGCSSQHAKLGGSSKKTKDIRSCTPRGYALAVFEAN